MRDSYFIPHFLGFVLKTHNVDDTSPLPWRTSMISKSTRFSLSSLNARLVCLKMEAVERDC